MGSCCITQGAQPGALWQLEGWDGGSRGRGYIYIYTLMSDSHSYVAETNSIV